MTTFAVTATAQPTNSPPRVRIVVTTSGTPTVTAVTLIRTDASGKSVPVRTSDGGPLQLAVSGSTYTGTLFDYEVPFSTAVTYSTVEAPATTSASVTVTDTRVWLVHPGVPSRSMPVEFRIDSFAEETLAARVGVFNPMGRESAVYISDGQRQGATSTFTVGTETIAEYKAIKTLVADAGVLFLNVPPSLSLGLDSGYIGVMDVRVKRRSNIGSAPQRDVEMPYVTVDMPIGGAQAQYTWGDVLATYGTWQDVINANATWATLLARTN